MYGTVVFMFCAMMLIARRWYSSESLKSYDFYSYPYFFFMKFTFGDSLSFSFISLSFFYLSFPDSMNLISVAIVKCATEQWITV